MLNFGETAVYLQTRFADSRAHSGYNNRAMTKRQLGFVFIALGILAAAGMFLMDFIGAGQFQGIGPAQRLALIGAGIVVIVGITLLPFEDNPA
jgi:hypothetical protein